MFAGGSVGNIDTASKPLKYYRKLSAALIISNTFPKRVLTSTVVQRPASLCTYLPLITQLNNKTNRTYENFEERQNG